MKQLFSQQIQPQKSLSGRVSMCREQKYHHKAKLQSIFTFIYGFSCLAPWVEKLLVQCPSTRTIEGTTYSELVDFIRLWNPLIWQHACDGLKYCQQEQIMGNYLIACCGFCRFGFLFQNKKGNTSHKGVKSLKKNWSTLTYTDPGNTQHFFLDIFFERAEKL